MGGNPWKAGKFASSLRLSLWSEHLGLHSTEVCYYSITCTLMKFVVFWNYMFFIFALQINKIADPVIDSTYKDIWMATARVRLNIPLCQDSRFFHATQMIILNIDDKWATLISNHHASGLLLTDKYNDIPRCLLLHP